MATQSWSDIIRQNPIGNRLEAFRASYRSICNSKNIPDAPDTVDRLDDEDVRNLAIDLLSALQTHPASRLLRSGGTGRLLFGDLLRLNTVIYSGDADLERIRPLLQAALAEDPDDELIWNRVCDAVTESTPPPRPGDPSVKETPWTYNISGVVNSSEHRRYMDDLLKEELGPVYIGLPGFHEAFFGDVPNLGTASEQFFNDCLGGIDPLFKPDDGWRGWPRDAKQDDVLGWFAEFSKNLAAFAERYELAPAYQRRLLARPNKPIIGSVGQRKMDIGFLSHPIPEGNSECNWTHILVPGELKSNPSADTSLQAWLDLGRYVREVFAAQNTRRFVLGFTLCGSLMRIWLFDRLGSIASEHFDINKDGLRFVSTILGFSWMNEEQLGFDPTIKMANGQRFIEIERNGSTERLILDTLVRPARCVASRATTCWKAYREGDPDSLLVIKDSWQYPERDVEGELLLEAANKGVVHLARYYHHETVQVRGMDDDIQGNIRRGLDITKAANYPPGRSQPPSGRATPATSQAAQRSGATSSSRKRLRSTQASTTLPLGKRLCSTPPVNAPLVNAPPVNASTPSISSLPSANRVHRRVIVSDYGIPIYKASSRKVLLLALADCIEGHRSLRQQAGLLHRDISIGNLMVGQDNRGFLIDLDLAIKEERIQASGAKGKTGTRAFMAVGALLGEPHSFMHDLESFFWVLFWICIHCNGPGQGTRVVDRFDKWNYADTEELAMLKLGTVSEEGIFRKTTEMNFTEYYQPLVFWVDKLRRVVFPDGRRQEREDSGLYERMKKTLQEASEAMAWVERTSAI
ncbi:hypothetical protein VTH06DRAFT_3515 [Thermothelomyces fergusii]